MEEGIDYYLNEDGLMVFTAAYHLKRGRCCQNRCKHCPWNFGKDGGLKTSKIPTKPSPNEAIEERKKSSKS